MMLAFSSDSPLTAEMLNGISWTDSSRRVAVTKTSPSGVTAGASCARAADEPPARMLETASAIADFWQVCFCVITADLQLVVVCAPWLEGTLVMLFALRQLQQIPPLVAKHLHPNDWHVRMARRTLQERAANKKLDPATAGSLDKILRECNFPSIAVHSGVSQEER